MTANVDASTIIHTTVDKFADDLASFDGSRRVAVLDATDEERREAIRRTVEAADDDPVSIDEDAAFDEIHAVIDRRFGRAS